jgi:NTE family protein
MSRSLRIGLALSGGGARGVAHLGVLSVFERENIPVHVIAGTSIGALIGAMYAIQPDVQHLQNKMFHFLKGPAFKKIRFEFLKRDHQEVQKAGLFSRVKSSLKRGIFYGISFNRQSYISEEEIAEIIGYLVDDIVIEKSKIPLLMNAMDLRTGQEYVFEKGPLRRALCATCALPGILPPIAYGEHLLIDGGWANPIPVPLAYGAGADLVIAVNTSESLRPIKELNNGFDMLVRADTVVRAHLAGILARKADVVIQPDVGTIHWADFSHPASLIQKGVEAAEKKMGEIQQLIRRKRMRKMFLG